MSGYKDQDPKAGACVESTSWSRTNVVRHGGQFLFLLSIIFAGLSFRAIPARAAVNVYLSTAAPSGLQADLLSNLTSQYVATFSASPYFPGTYTATLFRKNPNYQPPPQALDINKLTAEFISQSTMTFIYGFADGQAYERHVDLNTIAESNVNCSSSTYYDQFIGTTTYHTPIDQVTCNAVLSQVWSVIYQQNFSTPTVIPVNWIP